MDKEEWTNQERREFCLEHCGVSTAAKNSVPRWIYLSTITVAVMLGVVFAGWQKGSVKELETHLQMRLSDLQNRYTEDVGRFFNAAIENRKLLEALGDDVNEVKIKQGKIEAKQDLVLEKIKLTE